MCQMYISYFTYCIKNSNVCYSEQSSTHTHTQVCHYWLLCNPRITMNFYELSQECSNWEVSYAASTRPELIFRCNRSLCAYTLHSLYQSLTQFSLHGLKYSLYYFLLPHVAAPVIATDLPEVTKTRQTDFTKKVQSSVSDLLQIPFVYISQVQYVTCLMHSHAHTIG